MSLELIPRDIQFHILSFCNTKGLKVVQGLSKAWCQIASNDRLWLNLFELRFKEAPLQKNQYKEEFRKRANPIRLQKKGDLDKAVTSFFCQLGWNTKKQLICRFPNEPTYSLNFQQGFGPERGTAKGFKGLVDEVEYYEHTANISPGRIADQVIKKETSTTCHGAGISSPIPLVEQGIPLFQSCSYTTARHKFGWSCLEVRDDRFVNGAIVGTDVGWGNTLGYFSSVNGWKSPFTLFCTRENNGSPIWLGRIPINEYFKFVSIDSKGSVAWEQGADRLLTPHPRLDTTGQNALASALCKLPIVFPPKI